MNALVSMLFVNWQTTLLGALGAAATALGAYFSGQSGVWPYVGAAFIALVGFVAKDHSVSGTVPPAK